MTALIRERLQEGYQAEAEFNVKLAEEWFPLDEEGWQTAGGKKRHK